MDAPGTLSPLQRAAVALHTMRTELESTLARQHEPIAIIGLGCRFPGGADNPTRFWELLKEGRDAICEVPADRWDKDAYYSTDPAAPWKMLVKAGGFLTEPISHFDAEFFGISPREAACMDPQQRLLLEVSWEAIEDAGIPVDRLSASRTGVYVGVLSSDYGRIPFQSLRREDLPYMGTGNGLDFPAGRLSYVLGAQGPCMVVATACSSALVAVHLAATALRRGECDLAIAAAVNLVVYPDNSGVACVGNFGDHSRSALGGAESYK